MREFIAALRQLRFPIVLVAVAILVVQTLVAGLATAHATARLAAGGGAASLICHGNSDDGTLPRGQGSHDCCTFGTTSGPAALTSEAADMGRPEVVQQSRLLIGPNDVHREPRAIRAGRSQAPPIAS